MKTFLLLVLLVIIGWLTIPEPAKFKTFLQEKQRMDSLCNTEPRYTSYKILSIAYADYCAVGNNSSTQVTRSDKYLGLFGTYWKISD